MSEGASRIAFAQDLHGTDLEEGTAFAPRFDDKGLIPAIAAHAETGEVLMFAYMNAQALALSLETGEAHYWSRSRNELWRKGETSGNRQRIVEMRTDCDQDALWLKVEMTGSGACCHTGRTSCFYRVVAPGNDEGAAPSLVLVDAERQFDPKAVYGHAAAAKRNLKSS